MTNLAHNVSFHSKEKIAPSKSGIKQLARKVSDSLNLIARMPLFGGLQMVGTGQDAALQLPHGPANLGTLIETDNGCGL